MRTYRGNRDRLEEAHVCTCDWCRRAEGRGAGDLGRRQALRSHDSGALRPVVTSGALRFRLRGLSAPININEE